MNILRFFFEDLSLKLLSLLIAIILWFHSATEKNYTALRDTLIEYENLPSDITFRELPPQKIKVIYEAKGKDLIKLYFFKPKIVLNLEGKKVGKIFFELKEEDIRIPRGIEVYKIVLPKNILEFTLEEKKTKEVPIKIEFLGKPRKGYTVTSLEPAQQKIKITGPKSLIDKLEEVKCEDIEVSGKESSFYEYVKVLTPSKLVTVEPCSLRIYVSIEKEIAREFEKEPVIISPEGCHVEVEPERVKLTIKGPTSRVEKISPSDIMVMFNLIGFGEGEYYLPPKVFSPDSIQIEKIEPPFVRIKIKK